MVIQPTSRETILEEDETIISKTNQQGHIIYANRTFMRISLFSEEDLIGKPHNVIRHPDMPRGVYKMLWDTITTGSEYFGFIKNICLDGGYYWVFANITADIDSNQNLQGYYSVRRKPQRSIIQMLEPIYQEMKRIEQQYSPQEGLTKSVDYFNQFVTQHSTDYTSFIYDTIMKDA